MIKFYCFIYPQIVHRRLAARNILLTFLNDAKIAGFGPQPVNGTNDDGDVESGKPVSKVLI